MPKFSILAPVLVGAGLLLVAAPGHAQAPKAGHAAARTMPEGGVSAQAERPAQTPRRRTDAHTINVTLDSSPAPAEAGTPKHGSGPLPASAGEGIPATAPPQGTPKSLAAPR